MLAQAFRRAGCAVTVGESPWRLGAAEADLIGELAAGIAAAVAETGHVAPEAIAGWLEAARGDLGARRPSGSVGPAGVKPAPLPIAPNSAMPRPRS